ncbi:MAG: hypothetical protein LBG43_00495 [Treponema sp.]|nr:hypothetical protein [Treponema sp.]
MGSGRTEERALLNSACRWVKERIQQFRDELPFPSWVLTATTAASSSTTNSKTGVT